MNDMILTRRRWITALGLILFIGFSRPTRARVEAAPQDSPAVSQDQPEAPREDYPDDAVLQAMVDELQRSAHGLSVGGQEAPYFLQYVVTDTEVRDVWVHFGGIMRNQTERTRDLRTQVRLGSYQLDSGNMGWYGASAALPLEDDYDAIRHALWAATDNDYKTCLNVLSTKKERLKEKGDPKRPDDFSKAPPVRVLEPLPSVKLDWNKWVETVKTLSERFRKFPDLEDSFTRLTVSSIGRRLINTEGTRFRQGKTRAVLAVNASLRADDGTKIFDTYHYVVEDVDELPDLKTIENDLDAFAQRLLHVAHAPILEPYEDGPVLFDPLPSAMFFDALLASDLGARPFGLGADPDERYTNEMRLGISLMPRTLSAYDDPSQLHHEGQLLLGAQPYDHEAVKTRRVAVVEKGVLERLLSCRTPTRTTSESSGHGILRARGPASAGSACLYVEAKRGASDEKLKERLIQLAKENYLDYGIRIASTQRGGSGALGTPIEIYKVHVEDGREELRRGVRIADGNLRALNKIVATGRNVAVYNEVGLNNEGTSVIAPAILVEGLTLAPLDTQFNVPPSLKAPLLREEKPVKKSEAPPNP